MQDNQEQEEELFDEWFPLDGVSDHVAELSKLDEARSAVAATIMKNMSIEEMTMFVYEHVLVDLHEIPDEEFDLLYTTLTDE